MTYLVMIILGIIQGVAEFLPISSSGHLALAQQIPWCKTSLASMGDDLSLVINVTLHLASLVAVIIFLWKDIVRIVKGFFVALFHADWKNPDFLTAWFIVVASIPAALIGGLFNDFFANMTNAPLVVCALLIINGIILIISKRFNQGGRQLEEIGFGRSLLIGCCQALAILPGISRSGTTITGASVLGVKPEVAARFSFLMSIPVILGAGIFEAIKLPEVGISSSFWGPAIIAMIVTTIVALAALKLLFYVVRKTKLDIFGYYTILVGIIGMFIILL